VTAGTPQRGARAGLPWPTNRGVEVDRDAHLYSHARSLGTPQKQSRVSLQNDETPVGRGFRKRAGDGDRTGDVQLGKLPTFPRSDLKNIGNPRRTAS
jgi:hypothetical protein